VGIDRLCSSSYWRGRPSDTLSRRDWRARLRFGDLATLQESMVGRKVSLGRAHKARPLFFCLGSYDTMEMMSNTLKI